MPNLKLFLMVIILFALVAACGGQNNQDVGKDLQEENGVGQAGGGGTPTATLSVPTNTPLAENFEESDELPPLSYEEMLEVGVEAGNWTKEEGLVHFLKYFVGETNAADLPGVEDVTVKSGTGIVHLSDEMLAQAETDTQTQSEIERLL
jgi:hypothetical protein